MAFPLSTTKHCMKHTSSNTSSALLNATPVYWNFFWHKVGEHFRGRGVSDNSLWSDLELFASSEGRGRGKHENTRNNAESEKNTKGLDGPYCTLHIAGASRRKDQRGTFACIKHNYLLDQFSSMRSPSVISGNFALGRNALARNECDAYVSGFFNESFGYEHFDIVQFWIYFDQLFSSSTLSSS